MQVAAIICAHQNAQARVKKAAEVDAEYDAQEITKPVVSSEWTAMREALDWRLGVMEDRVVPAKEYVEKKLADVEVVEYRAEILTEVVAKDEVEPDTLLPVWDSRGRFSIRRGATKVPEPQNAEQLRRRLTVMKNAFVMISLKHTNRKELQGEWDRTFEEYKDYLLGEYVYMLAAKDADRQHDIDAAVEPGHRVRACREEEGGQAGELGGSFDAGGAEDGLEGSHGEGALLHHAVGVTLQEANAAE